MIIGKLSEAHIYNGVNDYLDRLFDFVNSNDLAAFNTGKIVLAKDELFVNIVEPMLKKAEEQKLEVHAEFIDVHIPLTGDEIIGVRHLDDLDVESDDPFDFDDDYALYSAPADKYVTVHPGEFCILFPGEAHAPAIGEGTIKKAIGKVLYTADLPF